MKQIRSSSCRGSSFPKRYTITELRTWPAPSSAAATASRAAFPADAWSCCLSIQVTAVHIIVWERLPGRRPAARPQAHRERASNTARAARRWPTLCPATAAAARSAPAPPPPPAAAAAPPAGVKAGSAGGCRVLTLYRNPPESCSSVAALAADGMRRLYSSGVVLLSRLCRGAS